MSQSIFVKFLNIWTIAKVGVILLIFVQIWPSLPVSFMFTIVASGSMAPNILKGDLLISLPPWKRVDVGDVVIVKVTNSEIFFRKVMT
jgi:hypothetical protein